MSNLEFTIKRVTSVFVAAAMLATASLAWSQDRASTVQPRLRNGASAELVVPLFKSRVVKLDEPAARVSVGSPDIADILILRATQLYVLGKDLGTTNVLLWDRNDVLIGTVSVEVTHDLEGMKAKIHSIFPDEPIEVWSSQRNIVLRGRVSSIGVMDAVVRMADGYLAQIQTAEDAGEFEQRSGSRREDKAVGEVINLLQVGGGQQVMLSIKVAEINRTELRTLDPQWNAIWKGSSRWSLGGISGGATFPNAVFDVTETITTGAGTITQSGSSISGLSGGIDQPWGPAIDEFAPNGLNIQDKGLFTTFMSDDFLFNLALNAAKNEGLAKILAEPTLTTLTGQQAEFLSGGEFPIPVPQDNNTVTIEFKEFGVGVRFLPTVLGNDNINLKINVDVSELNDLNTVLVGLQNTNQTFFVPSLTKRSAESTVELKDGQTIGIAGLISENLKEAVSKFPGLGDLPIIGYLFRSQEFLKGETELLIMVTPTIAKPIAPQDIRLPTDAFIEPSDTDFYLLGRMEGRPARSESGNAPEEGGTDGEYGQDVN